MKREVWAEFGDGSVAKYGVEDDDLPDLLARFHNHGMPCTLWIDGQIWKAGDRVDGRDSNERIDQSANNDCQF
jgi:hypothetical protein